jgi:hypothetical protein
MIMIVKTTSNRSYPKPDINNSLQDDVANIESALDMIDTDIQSLKTKVESAPPVPVLSSANITINSFNLSWSDLIEASFYCLDIATDETFSTFVGDYNNKKIAETSREITGLTSNIIYYCRIRSATNLVSSTNSIVLSITTLFNIVPFIQQFNYTGGMQTWAVPQGVTSIQIEACGAEGGTASDNTSFGGYGAVISGIFTVTPGMECSIVVGGMGLNGSGVASSRGGGGGGGTFVYSGNNLFIAAGGGGGARYSGSGRSGMNANVGNNGTSDQFNLSSGGTNGSGGGIYNSNGYDGGGGAGWLSDGASVAQTSGGKTKPAWTGGSAFTYTTGINGGYGGGGGSNHGSGGGGGYSGGGGGYNAGGGGGGGGGGSYNSGTNQSSASNHTGHGTVTIQSVQT